MNPLKKDIKAAREGAGLTQANAASLLRCTLNAWQKWEYGERKMHPAFWELFQIKIKAREKVRENHGI